MKCVTLNCDNLEMTEKERESQFLGGWVGVTMYENTNSPFNDRRIL